jgi:hypothetical protein
VSAIRMYGPIIGGCFNQPKKAPLRTVSTGPLDIASEVKQIPQGWSCVGAIPMRSGLWLRDE